jgi:Flp pilus assembly protein CpaB
MLRRRQLVLPARRRPTLAPSGRRRSARRNRLRRWGAAALAAVAGFVGVTALSPRGAAAPGVPTVVAARDLPAGAVLGEDDLTVEPVPERHRPDTAAGTTGLLTGRVLTSPVSAREVVTETRVQGAGMLAGQPAGTVAMSVPVLDLGTTGVAAGSRVDLYGTGTGELVARDTTVLALRAETPSAWSAAATTSLTVALDPATAGRVAQSVSALRAGEIFMVAVHRP